MKQSLMMWIFLVVAPFSPLAQGQNKNATPTVRAEDAAAASQEELSQEIARMDGALFAAFNSQNLDKMKALFTTDLEFYQDNEGLVDYAQTIKDFEAIFKQSSKLRRELVEGSMEVYPIKNYGAIETGSHKFCHVENGREQCGTFKFVHIWQHKDGAWRISRVISYNH